MTDEPAPNTKAERDADRPLMEKVRHDALNPSEDELMDFALRMSGDVHELRPDSDNSPEWREDALHWGRWQYDAFHRTLDFISNTLIYSIPLLGLADPKELFDWFAQLNEKTWMAPEHLGHFAQAVDEIVGFRGLAQLPPGEEGRFKREEEIRDNRKIDDLTALL